MFRVALLFSLLLLPVSYAQVYAGSSPEQIVRSTTDRILDLINRNLKTYEVDPSGFYSAVRDIALPHFDLRSMARRAIRDENWRTATETQRDALVTEYGNLMVRTYGTVLLQYRGQKISYLPTVSDSGGRVATVKMKVDHTGGRPPSLVDYMFRQNATGWRIFEVTIDGISIVTSNSLSYQDTIRRYGVDSLTDKLRQQNAVVR
jgi:phospholipid transport system substrate-binding protein